MSTATSDAATTRPLRLDCRSDIRADRVMPPSSLDSVDFSRMPLTSTTPFTHDTITTAILVAVAAVAAFSTLVYRRREWPARLTPAAINGGTSIDQHGSAESRARRAQHRHDIATALAALATVERDGLDAIPKTKTPLDHGL